MSRRGRDGVDRTASVSISTSVRTDSLEDRRFVVSEWSVSQVSTRLDDLAVLDGAVESSSEYRDEERSAERSAAVDMLDPARIDSRASVTFQPDHRCCPRGKSLSSRIFED